MNSLMRKLRRSSNVTDISNEEFSVSVAQSEVPTEFEVRKKIKYGNPLQAAWGIFMEYCRNSTIHGIRYLGERNRPILERVFWILVFSLSIAACTRLCMNIWTKWNQTPVIVSFSEKSTAVWDIPFPTIVICPEIQFQQNDYNYTEIYGSIRKSLGPGKITKNSKKIQKPDDISDLDYERFLALLQICAVNPFHDEQFGEEHNNIDIEEIFMGLIPSINYSVPFCKWRENISMCFNFVEPIVIHSGVCYIFNNVDETLLLRYPKNNYSSDRTIDWSLQDGYSEASIKENYPYRVLTAGARGGFYAAVQGLLGDIEYQCKGGTQGFQMMLLSPDESPQAHSQFIRIPFAQELLVKVKPTMIKTSDSLRRYEPYIRQCYFNGEKYLKYYKVYTQNHCNFECLTNHTLSKCGCVKFSMPHMPGTPICGPSKLQCISLANDEILKIEFAEGLKGSGENKRGETTCNCLPACTSLVYDFEISQADFDITSVLFSFNDSYTEENPGLMMSRLSLFFKNQQFITTKRSELYGTTDFLANCGGLLGLFMGVSSLSLVELLYFCTVRLVSNLRMRRSRRKTNSGRFMANINLSANVK